MDILITDVTEMHAGNYCVAGWNRAENRMVRPLPNGANWTGAKLAQYGIAPGVTIRVQPQGIATGTYPHRTEDTPINSANIEIVGNGFTDWFGHDAPALAANLNAGFDGNLQRNSLWNGVKQG